MAASPESPRAALDRARYFLSQAELLRGDQRTEFGHNLDAAIVFGRSAYHFLQSRATASGTDAAFVAWFNSKRAAMASDRLLEYFRKMRDLTLKERQTTTPKRVFASLQASAYISAHIEAVVKRGQPWYLRSPRILWQDARAAFLRPIQRWRYKAGLRLRRARIALRARLDRVRRWWAARRSVPSVREFYLDDPEGLDRNAVDLVRAYLARLDAIVGEAEGMFPTSVG